MAELRELSLRWDCKLLEAFLARAGLRLEPDLTYCCGLYEGDDLLACGGYSGHTIKCLAVREDRRGETLLNTLVSHLYTRLRTQGAQNVFVFTKPENQPLFRSLGFSPVARGESALLLESDRHGISRYLTCLQEESPFTPSTPVGAVVMNANPFTLGHQFLLEQAAGQCGTLHVFVVQEEKSVFPFDARLQLVQEGSRHIPGVVVHKGGPYIISSATFPSYFIKDPAGAAPAHASLDAALFASRIAPALCISVRFCGEEPLDPLTQLYNHTLARVLPQHGLRFCVLARQGQDGAPISASRVRKLLAQGETQRVKPLVPAATYAYLTSPQGAAIIEKLQQKDGTLHGSTQLSPNR